MISSKPKIRKKQIEILKQLSEQEREQTAKKVYQNFTSTKLFNEAQNIGFFWSQYFEFPTHQFIQKSLKKIYLPTIYDFSKRILAFRQFKTVNKLQTNHNLKEPTPDIPIKPVNELDLILVPGLAFARSNHARLGFGGGFYDRSLSNYQGPTIALIFDQQLVDEPTWSVEQYDSPINYFITKNEII